MSDELIRTAEWWLKTGVANGIGYVFMASFVGLFVWVAARMCIAFVRVIDGIARSIIPTLSHLITALRESLTGVFDTHSSFVRNLDARDERQTLAIESLTNTSVASGNNHSRTHESLLNVIHAGLILADRSDDAEVAKYLNAAKKALERP